LNTVTKTKLQFSRFVLTQHVDAELFRIDECISGSVIGGGFDNCAEFVCVKISREIYIFLNL